MTKLERGGEGLKTDRASAQLACRVMDSRTETPHSHSPFLRRPPESLPTSHPSRNHEMKTRRPRRWRLSPLGEKFLFRAQAKDGIRKKSNRASLCMFLLPSFLS